MNETITLIVSITLGVFAITAGTIEFLERMGFPTLLEKRRAEKNKKLILVTLEEVGIRPFKREFAQLSYLLQLKRSIPYSYLTETLDNLIAKYTRFVNQELVGVFEQTRLSYYIDLMGVLSDPEDLRVLSNIMCCQIKDVISDLSQSTINFNKVAAVKSGNPALALLVSIELQKPCILVDVTGGALSSDTIDGQIEPDDEVIILHDIVASGQIILLCANELTKRNAKVNHVFVIVERTDRQNNSLPTPSEYLSKSGLVLHSLRKMNDATLAKLTNKINNSKTVKKNDE